MRAPILDAVRASGPTGCSSGRHELDARRRTRGWRRGCPVAHVEAGLRSGDLTMPEERNRIEVDRLAALLFAPEERSRATLEAEGVTGEIEVVGDVMADASLASPARARALRRSSRRRGAYVVATIHREANVRPQPRSADRRRARSPRRAGRLPRHPRTRAALDRAPASCCRRASSSSSRSATSSSPRSPRRHA